jgi:hypothetical protein
MARRLTANAVLRSFGGTRSPKIVRFAGRKASVASESQRQDDNEPELFAKGKTRRPPERSSDNCRI